MRLDQLPHGANLDARNEDGYTPLMLACYWEQLGVVQMLLRQGADTSLASHNGRTCFDTARSDSVRALLATAPTSWEYKDPEGGATVVFSALVEKGRARRLSAGRRSGGDGD